jgi:hypothetical protein
MCEGNGLFVQPSQFSVASLAPNFRTIMAAIARYHH